MDHLREPSMRGKKRPVCGLHMRTVTGSQPPRGWRGQSGALRGQNAPWINGMGPAEAWLWPSWEGLERECRPGRAHPAPVLRGNGGLQ